MRNFTVLITLVLILMLPAACSEDETMSSLEKAMQVDKALMLPEGMEKKERKLTKDLKLAVKAYWLKKEIETHMKPELELLMALGRQILRAKGMAPEQAFGTAEDPRLALVPAVTLALEQENQKLYAQGLFLESLYQDSPYQAISPQITNNHAVAITQDIKFRHVMDCVGDVGQRVGFVTGSVYAGAAYYGVAATVIVGSITVGWAISAAGALYGAARVGECVADRERNPGCTISQRLDQSCAAMIQNMAQSQGFDCLNGMTPCSGQFEQCARELHALLSDKMGTLEIAYADTLQLAVAGR